MLNLIPCCYYNVLMTFAFSHTLPNLETSFCSFFVFLLKYATSTLSSAKKLSTCLPNNHYPSLQNPCFHFPHYPICKQLEHPWWHYTPFLSTNSHMCHTREILSTAASSFPPHHIYATLSISPILCSLQIHRCHISLYFSKYFTHILHSSKQALVPRILCHFQPEITLFLPILMLLVCLHPIRLPHFHTTFQIHCLPPTSAR